MSSESIPQRTCKQCARELPLTTEFWHKDKTALYGFTYTCKECAKARARQWVGENPERNKANCARRFAEKPEAYQVYRDSHRQEGADYKREWRRRNPDKVKAHKSASQKRNRKAANERTKRWGKRNPEKLLAGVHRRRARKLNNGGSYTQADIELQLRSQKGRCWHCGKPLGEDQTIDHLIPLSRGGSNAPRNIVIAHLRCNLSKGAKLPHEWNGRLL